VEKVYAIAGTSNEQGGVAGELRENIGQLTLTVSPPVSREREEVLMARMRTALDGEDRLEYRFGRPAYFSFRTPIEVEIRGYNLLLLERLADELVSGQSRADAGRRGIRRALEGPG
jgi:HAE1 family hydrophobic/amphiphilic exporter-1